MAIVYCFACLVQRNFDPTLHPYTTSREYVRALNATKLERVFAKPFIGSLDGHTEGVSSMMNNPVSLSKVVTASYNGEVLTARVIRYLKL